MLSYRPATSRGISTLASEAGDSFAMPVRRGKRRDGHLFPYPLSNSVVVIVSKHVEKSSSSMVYFPPTWQSSRHFFSVRRIERRVSHATTASALPSSSAWGRGFQALDKDEASIPLLRHTKGRQVHSTFFFSSTDYLRLRLSRLLFRVFLPTEEETRFYGGLKFCKVSAAVNTLPRVIRVGGFVLLPFHKKRSLSVNPSASFAAQPSPFVFILGNSLLFCSHLCLLSLGLSLSAVSPAS